MKKVKKEEKQIVLWNKSKEHDKITEELIDKKRIYNEKQNLPELVVEDIMMTVKPFIKISLSKEYQKEVEEDIRNQIYAVLLKRGVNKWLFVRKLIIRLKKKYQYKISEIQRALEEDKDRYKDISMMYDALSNKDYWKLKGELKAYSKIREELMLLANSPRYIIWNYKKVGLIDFVGLQKSKTRKWKKLFEELMNSKFRR